MRKVLLFAFSILFLSYISIDRATAQSCVPTTLNHNVINISCGATCATLNFKVPHLKSTESYAVNSIAYQPGAWTTPGGTVISSIYIDDQFSDSLAIGFPFCFYGDSYSKCVVGSNGVISFDILTNANKKNAYLLKVSNNPQTIPYAGGSPNTISQAYYPRAAIMGAYQDIDPNPSSTDQPADRRIEYRVEGTAPCRKFVASFYHIPYFTCEEAITSTQMVLYENTGLVDVFLETKPVPPCSFSTNDGLAILGIQNWNRNAAVAVPGRNCTLWSATNEGWRFTPNGATSRYISSELLSMSGTVLGVADTSTSVQGMLDISFPNICPVANVTQYVVRTTFSSCPTGTNMISLDTITVNRNTHLPVTSTFTQTTCGANAGTITVNVTPGNGTAPFSYGIDGNPTQASNVFTGLAAGAHIIYATDATGCDTTFTVNITTLSNIPATANPTATTCQGASNGTITVVPTGGVAPYTFTLTGPGGPYVQTNPVFTGLLNGTYSLTFSDNSGCSGAVTNIVVAAGPAVTSTFTTTAPTCQGAANGTLTITPTPAGVYTYTLTPGAVVQNNNPVFTGLVAGSYSVTYQNALGCSGTRNNMVVAAGPALTGTASPTGTSCSGVNDGSITVTPGTAGVYTYTLNPGAIVQNNNPVFSNLAPGNYSVTFANALGCSRTINNIVVTAGAALTGTATTTATSCPTRNDGTITITPGGTGPYTFTLNPGNVVQASPVFTGLAAGTYTITFSTASGCAGSVPTNPVVAQGPNLTSTVINVHQPVCANINDGSITINPTTGTGPFTFVLNPGGITQTSPTYNNLAPASYSYSFTSANGCTGTGGFTLTSNPSIKTPSVKVSPLCNGNNNGSITINASGGVSPYQYAVGPTFTYQATNSFTNLIAGTYDFRIKDAAGCTKDTTIVLSEPAVLTASATNTKVATCNGNDGTITVTAGGGTTPYQYSINNGTTYQAAPLFIAPDTGFYPNIKVKDAKGCLVNTSVTVALNDTMRLSLGAAQTICVGSSVTLQPQTNAATSIFVWTAQGQPISTLSDPGIKNPVATPVDTATYTLNAQWGVCKRQSSIIINVLHKPIVSAGLDTAICNQATQTIPAVATLMGSATDTSGTVTYLWTPSSKVSFPNQPVTPAKTDSTQQFILTVTDNYGCNFTVRDTVIVFVQPPVQAFAGHDTIAMYNRPHQLLATGGVSYLWTPAGPLNNANIANPLATLTADTRFTVVVKDIAGCEGYDTVFLKVYEGPIYHVPTAFSPNGDGRNDIFRPIPSGIASTDYFRVFNRFGELLFETKDWLKGWDGTYRGKQQATGTYVWMVRGKDYNGRVVEQKGTVVLVH